MGVYLNIRVGNGKPPRSGAFEVTDDQGFLSLFVIVRVETSPSSALCCRKRVLVEVERSGLPWTGSYA